MRIHHFCDFSDQKKKKPKVNHKKVFEEHKLRDILQNKATDMTTRCKL